jgi:hypothetical protein
MDTYGVYSHDFADDRAVTATMMQEVFDGILEVSTNEH